MNKWEYKEVRLVTRYTLESECIQHGRSGWELCAAVQIEGSGGYITLMFKRPVES
jgi:hypothetical protein